MYSNPTSFRLYHPRCPRCAHPTGHFDRTSCSNLWRVPLAGAIAFLITPLVGLKLKCSHCGHRFTSKE